jgi:hypothetical protein
MRAGKTIKAAAIARSEQQHPWGVLSLLLVLLVSLVTSATASATSPLDPLPGIDQWWGNTTAAKQTVGGLFSKEPHGVAVNGTTGDVYVADTEDNRIQRFSGAGAFKEAWGRNVDAINPETGYERCTVAANCQAASASTGAGGDFSEPTAIAVDQSTGNVYVVDALNRRVEEFAAAGAFLRAFGQDVVSSGPDNSSATNAVQTLSVSASGGKYTLAFEGSATGELAFNASAAQIKSALEGLASIGAGNIEVTGAAPSFTMTFKGVLANSPQPLIVAASAAGEPLSGGTAAVANTTTGATGYEVCVAASGDVCKAATAAASSAGAFGTFGGTAENQAQFGQPGSGLTVVPAGPPNAGDVLVADAGNRRVQEFTAAGQFVRAFGWNVTVAGPSNKNFASGPEQANELQRVTVKATSGEFKLIFGSGGPGVSETGNLPSNASAAVVQSALNGLTNISTGGGSVIVTGGPGGAAGTSPYEVRFSGGLLGGKDVAQMGAVSVGLAGGVPSSGIATTTVLPGNSGFEVCNAASFDVCGAGIEGAGRGGFAANTPSRVAEDGSGRIYTLEQEGNFRVQRFTLPGNVPTPQGDFAPAALRGSATDSRTNASEPKNNTTELAVDPAGSVFVVKAFPEGTGNPPAIPAGAAHFQQRVLRIDPVSEMVIETMVANPGSTPNESFENVEGLGLGSGTTIYATTGRGAAQARARVWRIEQFPSPAVSGVEDIEVGASSAVLATTISPSPIPLETAYRFEYSSDGITWTPVPVPDAMIGNGSAGGEAGTCPSPKAAICQIRREISGLVPNTTYQVRLVTYSIFNAGAATITAAESFTTQPSPPQVLTGVGVWSGPPASEPSLRLGGTINPGNDRTTYRFQYVDDASYQADTEKAEEEGKSPEEVTEAGYRQATTVPTAPAEAGRSLTSVAVHEDLSGLDPAQPYDFRLVAVNSVATTRSNTRHVSPPLPGARFYELVSAGESFGQGVSGKAFAVADNGARAMFSSLGFGQPRSLPNLGDPYVSERGVGGWLVADMSPDPNRAADRSDSFTSEINPSADLGSMLWTEGSAGEETRSEAQFGIARFDGSLVSASPQLTPLQRNLSGGYTVLGTSADLSTVAFRFGVSPFKGSVALLPGENLVTENFSNLYEIMGAGGGDPALGIVNRANGKSGAVIGGVCGAWLGNLSSNALSIATHAVSADGSVVYFGARPGAPAAGNCPTEESKLPEFAGPLRLYKRVNGEATVEVSAPQCSPTPACPGSPEGDDEFRGASDDGSAVFFTTPRRLVNSDTNNASDLYIYDASPPPGQPNLVQASHGNGSEAKVLGVLDNANDGSRVYFVAEGALTGENSVLHKTPAAGAKNLYVYERDDAHPAGSLTFIAALASGPYPSGDQNEWEQGRSGEESAAALPVSGEGGDGHALLFISHAQLLPVDTDSAFDLYLYDEDATEVAKALRCVSCAGGQNVEVEVSRWESIGASRGDRAQEVRGASEDLSKVVFTTREALLPADENIAADVYLWEELSSGRCSAAAAGPTGPAYAPATAGCLTLVSVGAESQGSLSSGNGGPPLGSSISPDGRNVFFTTAAPLVGADTNNAPDIYDARVDGGFPTQQRPAGCEGQESCQGVPVPVPLPTTTTPTSTSPSAGNVTPAKRCGRGRVRRHGRCVKKPAHDGHRQKRHAKRANHDRGGKR